MGNYYDTKCLDCEYEFHAIYGRPGNSQKENKVVKSIEDGNSHLCTKQWNAHELK